jgi:4-amino-4-deoxy-L-arabinose transferase-like glycosyltransferase
MIGRQIKDELTGFYASLLYTASVYCFIISGTFILPDAPQLFFWLISLYLLVNLVQEKEQSAINRKLLYLGTSIGFAMLSKYQSVFLWIGAFLYFLIFNRYVLKKRALYFSILISVIIFSPVIWWNIDNHFISYTYQGGRVNTFSSGVHAKYLLTELAGEFFYNNPVNFILVIIALMAAFREKEFISNDSIRVLLCLSLPLIAIVLFLSLFNPTLPHWTGPAYLSLILIAAAWLSSKQYRTVIPRQIAASIAFLLLTVVLGITQINYGLINFNKRTDNNRKQTLGKHDPSLDMFGWRQLKQKFSLILSKNDSIFKVNEQRTSYSELQTLNAELICPDAPIVSTKWFPAANLDYYVAQPLRKNLFVIGDLEAIHKYFWINKSRGGLKKLTDAWFINMSNNYTDPQEAFGSVFLEIIPSDTIPIIRNNHIVKYAFIYKLRNYSPE